MVTVQMKPGATSEHVLEKHNSGTFSADSHFLLSLRGMKGAHNVVDWYCEMEDMRGKAKLCEPISPFENKNAYESRLLSVVPKRASLGYCCRCL